MKKRSKQNNPEQKTQNAVNSHDFELGQEQDIVQKAKQKNKNKTQPTKSKVHPE